MAYLLILLALLFCALPSDAAYNPGLGRLAPDPFLIDASSWPLSAAHYSLNFASGSSSNSEFGLQLQIVSPATGSSISYERAGELIQTLTNDPSTGGITRDMVGIDARGAIGAANSTGRAWGVLAMSSINAGGDGFLQGVEIDVVNNGTDQTSVNTGTSKYGLSVDGSGTNPITAALNMGNANAHYELFTINSSGPTGFSVIKDQTSGGSEVFNVDGASGTTEIQGVPIAGPVYTTTGAAFCNRTSANPCHETAGTVTTASSGLATVTFTAPASFPNMGVSCVCSSGDYGTPNYVGCGLSSATVLNIKLNTAVADVVNFQCVGS